MLHFFELEVKIHAVSRSLPFPPPTPISTPGGFAAAERRRGAGIQLSVPLAKRPAVGSPVQRLCQAAVAATGRQGALRRSSQPLPPLQLSWLVRRRVNTMLKSGRGVRGALKAPAPAARSPPSQGCHEPEEDDDDGESMELRAAAALCLCCLWSSCRLRYGQLDAAVVRPLVAASDAEAAAAAAAAPGLWKSKPGERLNGDGGVFGNGTVVPHDYMIALYRRLAGGQDPPRPEGEISDAPNTVTGFADQAWAQPRGERTNRPESPPRAPPPPKPAAGRALAEQAGLRTELTQECAASRHVAQESLPPSPPPPPPPPPRGSGRASWIGSVGGVP
ncbi:growth/differentiation factor 7 [Crotalus adamanteus]|uniref:Growth/differentiation factor 7 n=1 Tax=Crotalus adamanteus TaxID=8729 RepID=A0AAW1CBU7_CROAD